jgi:soluble lytic murein transglycosylase-like protein
MPATAARYGLSRADLENPERAFTGALKYRRDIRNILAKGGVEPSEANVLASYNAGEGRVLRNRGVPRIRETQDYVSKILGGGARPQVPAGDLYNQQMSQTPSAYAPGDQLTVSQSAYKPPDPYKPMSQGAMPTDINSFAGGLWGSMMGGVYGGKAG